MYHCKHRNVIARPNAKRPGGMQSVLSVPVFVLGRASCLDIIDEEISETVPIVRIDITEKICVSFRGRE
jgi:hypothetical protein